MSNLSTGSSSQATEKLAADVECYKRQIAEMQQLLDQRAATAAAEEAASQHKQRVVSLEAELAAVQAEKSAAAQEAQQQAAAAEEAQQQLLLQINVLNEEAAGLKQLADDLQRSQHENAELRSRAQGLQEQLDASQQQLQELELERQALQQQADRVAALEAEVAALQQQVQQLLLQQQQQRVAVAAQDGERTGHSSQLSTADSTAAVSAIRAATHSLLLQSNPFEVRETEARALSVASPGFCQSQSLRVLACLRTR